MLEEINFAMSYLKCKKTRFPMEFSLIFFSSPDGIESAWIGGYTRQDDPETWRWLASGETIENNGMWRRNLTDSAGGCLLLDRHVCESPVYVGTACDRKRDVLCQKRKILNGIFHKFIIIVTDAVP